MVNSRNHGVNVSRRTQEADVDKRSPSASAGGFRFKARATFENRHLSAAVRLTVENTNGVVSDAITMATERVSGHR